MSPTLERDRAIAKARLDFPAALDLARRVSSPWFRCQALAWVARYAPAGEVARIAEEAAKVAQKSDDSYERLAALAWPVRALVELGLTQPAERLVRQALTRATEVNHPVRRADALFLLTQAGWGLSWKIRISLTEVLFSSCHQSKSWRAARIIHDVILLLSREDFQRAEMLTKSLPDGRLRRKIERSLADSAVMSPREFFR
jgi:hypothetical protein